MYKNNERKFNQYYPKGREIMLSIFDDRFPVYYTVIFIVMSFVLGAVIGSFLNVVIIRVPRHEPISGAHNRSHCMSCGKQLSNIDLIPILSYIFLGGKCRFCKAKISPRYWIVELTTAVAYTLSIIFLGLSASLGIMFVLIAALIVASGVDIDRMEIPYGCSIVITALGIAATIVSAVIYDPDAVPSGNTLERAAMAVFNMPWYDHLIGAAAISVPFAVLAMFGAMGGGDMQLMAAAGLLIGWKNIIPAAAIGIVLGAIGGSIELLSVPKGAKKRAREKSAEIAAKGYDEQKENGIYVIEGKTEAIYGSLFKGNADIEPECIDEKLWSGKPDIPALNRMLEEELPDISKFGISIVIENIRSEKDPDSYVENGKIRSVSCKRQVVFGPYLSVGIFAAYIFGETIVSWYTGLI